jgi:hypothetical protein
LFGHYGGGCQNGDALDEDDDIMQQVLAESLKMHEDQQKQKKGGSKEVGHEDQEEMKLSDEEKYLIDCMGSVQLNAEE